ncbi:hypothetical protein B0E53_03073 [Micromonospora sp. MH33]|nr:hypothetical protein B0E53_03073 [Micromonospora sp. MH33]
MLLPAALAEVDREPDQQRHHHQQHADQVAQHHPGLRRPAGVEPVQQRERPGDVRHGVQRAPEPLRTDAGEPDPHDAGPEHADHQQRGHGAQPDVEAPAAEERHHRVGRRGPAGRDLGDHVEDQPGHAENAGGPVGRLEQHPVPDEQHQPVGGEQPEHHGEAERDQGDHPGEELGEEESVRVHDGAGAGQFQAGPGDGERGRGERHHRGPRHRPGTTAAAGGPDGRRVLVLLCPGHLLLDRLAAAPHRPTLLRPPVRKGRHGRITSGANFSAGPSNPAPGRV